MNKNTKAEQKERIARNKILKTEVRNIKIVLGKERLWGETISPKVKSGYGQRFTALSCIPMDSFFNELDCVSEMDEIV